MSVLTMVGCSTDENLDTSQEIITEETETTSIDKSSDNRNGDSRDGNGRETTMYSKEQDEELQAMLDEVTDKFELREYTSPTGESMEYYLFMPENYDDSQKYPLLMFIPDASVVGKENEYSITQGYGAGVWVTDEAQAKNPAIVIVPIFKGVAVNDNFEVNNEPELAVEIINSLINDYSIDENRIYTTGQSMGCMISFHLNLKYPDLFAASLFVGGQWDTSIMLPLKDQKFFYIVAEGDSKASKGQAELMELFSENGVSYSAYQWDASLSSNEQNANVYDMLSEGNDINFVTFNLGTTYPEGAEQSRGGEHMTSFDFAYKIEAVHEWLFNQSK